MSTKNYITKNWSAAERMAVVYIITDKIRDDINLGTYGMLGRPNIQSVHEFMAADKNSLNKIIDDINKIIDDYRKNKVFSFKLLVEWYEEALK